MSTLHNVPIATLANGFAGLDTELRINGPLQVKQVAQLAEWQKSKIYDYGGRAGSAMPKFNTGECGIVLASSSARANVVANLKAEFGVGMLPYLPDVPGAPQNSILGGVSLWYLNGQKTVE